LLLSNWCCGQQYTNNDSLLKVYNSSAHDTIRIRAILALGWNLWESNPERSNAYAKKGLEAALALNNKLWIGEAYRLLGTNYVQKDDFVNAAKYYLIALEHQEKAGNKMAMARVYNNLGVLYEEQSMFTEALNAYEEALKLKEGEEERWKHDELSNIGIIYNRMENYPKAEEYLKEALRIEHKYGFVRSAAMTLQSLGNVAMNKGNTAKADSLFKRAVVILDSLGDEASVRVCLLTISVMYYQTGKHAEAAIYSHKARAMIKGQPSLSNLEIIYTVFSEYERSKGDFKTALLYSDSVIQVKERLYSTELAAQTAGLLEKYKTEKAEKENIILKTENETIAALANKRKIFIWIFLITIVFIIGFIALYVRQNKLKTQQKSIELKHQVLRSQINPHFIFNALNAIQKLYLENKTQLADEYLGDFGHLLRKILDIVQRHMFPFTKRWKHFNCILIWKKTELKMLLNMRSSCRMS
jgi:tetratricopeptide (TPR) repeat protein